MVAQQPAHSLLLHGPKRGSKEGGGKLGYVGKMGVVSRGKVGGVTKLGSTGKTGGKMVAGVAGKMVAGVAGKMVAGGRKTVVTRPGVLLQSKVRLWE